MSVIFPKDASIHKDFVEFGGKKIDYNNIKSIAVYVKQTTTNLTALTGIPTWSNLSSAITIKLIKGNSISVGVTAYEEWGPFKNKKGMNTLNDGLAFSRFLEEKTFEQRVQNYLKTGTNEIYFKYQGHEFLKDKKIRLGNKIYASFDPNEYSVKQGFKRLTFEKKGVLNTLIDLWDFKEPNDEIYINLNYDEDVIMYLINKFI